VCVEGVVSRRPKGTENKQITTGEIEVAATDVEVLNEADTLPLEIEEKEIESSDETRLKYRFLDLRKQRLQKNLMLKAKIYEN
jgi:aspartyl-tRNA synthetase